MKKSVFGIIIIVAFTLVGCGSKNVASAMPNQEQEVSVSVEATNPISKVDQDMTQMTPISSETTFVESENVEEPEDPIEDDSKNTFDCSFLDNPELVDYQNYYNGDIFELDDYCTDLGYKVSFGDPVVSDMSYYTISSCGRDYSITNTGTTLRIAYVDFAEDLIYSMSISRFSYHGEPDMIIRAANHDSQDVPTEYIEEITTVLKMIATSEVDFAQLPISVEYSYVVAEGRWQYQFDNTLIWEAENKIISKTINYN